MRNKIFNESLQIFMTLDRTRETGFLNEETRFLKFQ